MRHLLRFSAAAFAVALLMSLSTPAVALNGITFGTPALSVNYNTLQFRLPYTGDDNTNATILVRYSKGNSFQASKADTAVVPFRDTQLRRFTGVIPWLDQGTKYTLQITVTDPDGGGTTITPAFVTTLASPPHTIPANRLFVGPSGNDANVGTLALPKRTIMGAVSALTAGGQVRVLPGIYYETAWLQQEGTPSSYYSIVGHGNPDSVIVDGSDPTLLNTTWSPYLDNTGAQINAIYYKVTSTATTANVANIVAGWGQRLHTKQTMDQLKNFAAYPLFPSQGWFKNVDTLFVRLEGGADPSLTTMHVATRAFGLRMTGKYWRAESLTVRFTSDKGFFLGHFISPDSSATGAVIRNCRGYSIGLQGIYGNNNVDKVLVDSCYFEDGRVDTWGYSASKLHFEENTTGVTAVGRSWVIRNNVFTGHANGVQVVGSATDTVTKFGGADAELPLFYDF